MKTINTELNLDGQNDSSLHTRPPRRGGRANKTQQISWVDRNKLTIENIKHEWKCLKPAPPDERLGEEESSRESTNTSGKIGSLSFISHHASCKPPSWILPLITLPPDQEVFASHDVRWWEESLDQSASHCHHRRQGNKRPCTICWRLVRAETITFWESVGFISSCRMLQDVTGYRTALWSPKNRAILTRSSQSEFRSVHWFASSRRFAQCLACISCLAELAQINQSSGQDRNANNVSKTKEIELLNKRRMMRYRSPLISVDINSQHPRYQHLHKTRCCKLALSSFGLHEQSKSGTESQVPRQIGRLSKARLPPNSPKHGPRNCLETRARTKPVRRSLSFCPVGQSHHWLIWTWRLRLQKFFSKNQLLMLKHRYEERQIGCILRSASKRYHDWRLAISLWVARSRINVVSPLLKLHCVLVVICSSRNRFRTQPSWLPHSAGHTSSSVKMPGLNRLKEALERHRENKDINIKYKTPLTGMLIWFERDQTDATSTKHQHICRRTEYWRCL